MVLALPHFLHKDAAIWCAEQQVHPFVLQFNDLIKSIENGTELECSGEYGRSVIHAVTAMYESSRQREEMILLPGI